MKKNNYSLTIFCLVAFAFSAMAQSPGTNNVGFGIGGYEWYDDANMNEYGSNSIAVQPDGKVVFGGTIEVANNNYDLVCYRVNPDGSLDNNFNFDGKYTFGLNDDDRMASLALQPDGKILLCGYTDDPVSGYDIVIQRLNSNGLIDNTFGNNGTVQLDRSGNAVDVAQKIVVAPDGKIYVAGTMQILNEIYFLLYRLNSDGSVDSSFTTDGNVFYRTNQSTGLLYDMELASDGDIFLAGYIEDNGQAKMVVIKYTNQGFTDNSFAGDGVKIFSPGLNKEGALYNIEVLPGDKVLGVGITDNGGNLDGLMIQLTASGLLDPQFSSDGIKYFDFGIGATDYFIDVKRLADGNYLGLVVIDGNFKKGQLVQLDAAGDYNLSYGGGSGKLDISITAGDDWVMSFAMNNSLVYTIGSSVNGASYDIFINSSHVSNPVGISEQTLNPSTMKIFPNPIDASDNLSVILDEEITGNVNVTIVSITGELVYSDSFYKLSNDYQHTISMKELKRGVYMVELDNKGRRAQQKLIVR